MKDNVKKVRAEWDEDAKKYALKNHTDEIIDKIVASPRSAFHKTTWDVISSRISSFKDLEVCIPSSGDNLAVFAFSLMGANVTSCDISDKQLENAAKVADKLNLDIKFVCSNTMELSNIESNKYDFVYTSNGVHVWIDDLESMYKNIYRILKKGAIYTMFEIHPFTRPFKDSTTKIEIAKPYDMTGPFNNGTTYGWRIQDILNAMIKSGLSLTRVEEVFGQDYTYWTNWWDSVEISDAEKTRLMDYKSNPMAALPQMIILGARK